MLQSIDAGRARVVSEALSNQGANEWADRRITIDEADLFARGVTPGLGERATVAQNLFVIAPTQTVRGVFFEGVSRVVAEAKGAGAVAELLVRAGVPARTVAFRAYPHRDFYKLYYLAARLLYPALPLTTSLRELARTFFPIFKSSLLGKTMSALMGDNPRTILSILAKAYNISVDGNEHACEITGDREILWRCKVEPVDWYPETFGGIIEGTMATHRTAQCRVKMQERRPHLGMTHYTFKVTW